MKEIDVYKVIEGKSPGLAKRVPRWAVDYLRRTIHEREINEILSRFSDLHGVEAIRGDLGHMKVCYSAVGVERLGVKGRCMFASMRRFVGLDGLVLADVVAAVIGGVKVVVDDLWRNIDPIKELFVPVNKHGRQNEKNVEAFNDAFESDVPIITFPAGLCSRRLNGQVNDVEWKPSFVKKAVEFRRDIVPVYFDGRLSNFFYRLANVRKALGLKVNIEMLYLPDEMFRQGGSDFEIRIGTPIMYDAILDGRTPRQAADYVRRKVYAMRPIKVE